MPTFSRQQALANLDAHNAKMLIRIAQDTAASDAPIVTARGATAAGDERKLRGIPAIGRGVQGCINGTRPGGNLR